MSYKQFDVYIQDRPGEISRVAEALARNAVNIRGMATDASGGRTGVHIITDDDVTARNSLKAAQLDFKEQEVVVVSMADQPGELSKLTKKLARGGVNINSLFMLGGRTNMVEIAMTVDRVVEAKKLLDFS
ncbi:MAG: ACT domain-containing protein [Methanomassiliicoccales archaeon]|nr:ACT domain-containing protein [Methanomassiliicoccales archaeon]